MLSEQEQIRRNSLAELYKLGINPYPQAAFPVNIYTEDILSNFDDNNPDQFQEVTLAGRIMSRRIMLPLFPEMTEDEVSLVINLCNGYKN